jgi:WS/DGAT/MGAT family acyltransferase
MLRDLLGPRVVAVPELNRRVHLTRWGEGLPVWIVSPADLTVHVRPGPPMSTLRDVETLAGDLMGRPLPRDRPLWDLTVCAGPGPDVVTVLLRLHHALADGVRGVRLLRSLFDTPTPPPRAVAAVTERVPTRRELHKDAWRARAAGLRRLGTLPRRLPAITRMLATGAIRTAAMVHGSLPPTSLLGPVHTARTVRLVTADLADVRATAHVQGATVNDVLLAGVAAGATALLTTRGEALPPRMPVSVPVSLRGKPSDTQRQDAFPDGGNQVGVMLVPLPLDIADPAQRIRRIAAATRQAKHEARRAGTLELTRTRLGTRLMGLLAQRQHAIALFVTNVPGPAEPLHLAGAQLRKAWPLTGLGGNVRTSIAALSYNEVLHVTVTADTASTPDLDTFATALQETLQGASNPPNASATASRPPPPLP